MTHPVLLNPGILAGDTRPSINRGYLRRIPTVLLIASALVPVISWFVKRLDDGSDEPLGLLALGLALFLAWKDRGSLQTSPRSKTAGALLILTSVLSIGCIPPMLRAAIAIAGAGIWFGIHRKPGVMGLLILSLPVVASLQFYAGYPMRVAAAGGAVGILKLGGIVVTRSGVNIDLAGSSISVDPACSGIRMLWHALAAAMALAAMHRVSWGITVAGGILAVLLVIPANVFRAAWLVSEESGRFHGSGLSHGNIGLVCFAVVLVPLWIVLSKHALPTVTGTPATPPKRHGNQ